MLVQAIIKRILIGVVTLLVVSIIIFIGTSLLPGDVANIILGQMATPESLAALRAVSYTHLTLPTKRIV